MVAVDGPLDRLAQIVPQVPTIGDLDRLRRSLVRAIYRRGGDQRRPNYK